MGSKAGQNTSSLLLLLFSSLSLLRTLPSFDCEISVSWQIQATSLDIPIDSQDALDCFVRSPLGFASRRSHMKRKLGAEDEKEGDEVHSVTEEEQQQGKEAKVEEEQKEEQLVAPVEESKADLEEKAETSTGDESGYECMRLPAIWRRGFANV